jgi:hypothetical protein
MRHITSSKLMPAVRLALLRIGGHVTPMKLESLRFVLGYLELGRWLHSEHPGATLERSADKFALFEIARRHVTGQEPLYLEFGVFRGRSMRWWSSHLSQPGANLVGFDSFEGLPEDWRDQVRSGHFKTGGPPQIDDSRVSFQVGWFKDSLPHFSVPEHDQLIINVDCDLYSSAITVLRWAEPYMRPGTLIYFDEFCDRDHEMRAFREWGAQLPNQISPIGFAEGGVSWLFEVTSH